MDSEAAHLLGATSYIGAGLACACCLLPLYYALNILIVTATMTTVAVFNIDSSSVLIYHPVWLVLFTRIALREWSTIGKRKLFLFPFLVYALLSIPMALLSTDIIVINVDSMLDNVKFSFQQLTQYAYLFIAVTTAWMTELLVRTGVSSPNRVLRALDVGMYFVLIVALLQKLLPTEIINAYLRNSIHTMYNTVGADNRISSTFQEPSMLSLYLVPMMALHVRRYSKGNGLKSPLLVALSFLICIENNSSSAFLGIAVLASLWVASILSDFYRRKSSAVSIIASLSVVALIVALLLSGAFDEGFETLAAKLQGVGESGSDRTRNLMLSLSAFARRPIFGVGWGTVRCEGLVGTWLAELGIVGMALFVVPFAGLLCRLIRISKWTEAAMELVFYLVVWVVILMVSTGEPYYLSPWIVMGLANSLCSKESVAESECEQSLEVSERSWAE